MKQARGIIGPIILEILRNATLGMVGSRGLGMVSEHALSAFQAYDSLCLFQDGPLSVGAPAVLA